MRIKTARPDVVPGERRSQPFARWYGGWGSLRASSVGLNGSVRPGHAGVGRPATGAAPIAGLGIVVVPWCRLWRTAFSRASLRSSRSAGLVVGEQIEVDAVRGADGFSALVRSVCRTRRFHRRCGAEGSGGSARGSAPDRRRGRGADDAQVDSDVAVFLRSARGW